MASLNGPLIEESLERFANVETTGGGMPGLLWSSSGLNQLVGCCANTGFREVDL